MASLPSSLRGKSGLPSVRFLGAVKQPDSPSGWTSNSGAGGRSRDDGDGDLFELDEGDVVWSPASYSDLSESHSPSGSVGSSSPMSAASSFSPGGSYRPRHGRRGGRPFTPERFGLSAALAEEPGALVQQRKPATVLPRTVPPVAASRSGNDGYASGPGRVFGQSAPMNVPAWPGKGARMGEDKLGEMDEWGEGGEWEEDDGDDGEMVPPHLIVARSHGMSFSVFEGVGRTLKGRDLRRVRNAVFQKTGFLD